MSFNKIFKREDGSSVQISVSISIQMGLKSEYIWGVDLRKTNRHKFMPAVPKNCPTMRAQGDYSSRSQYKEQVNMSYITPEELHEAKLGAWESIKPSFE